jgi:23S rRNA pseudouridine2605 synthase
VRVNQTVRRDPERPVGLDADRIEVDGQAMTLAPKVYLMLNKPRGVVTTAADEQDRKTVYDGLDRDLPWVAPVGRLDKASEGLLLLTNDSEWAARVTAPETHLDKTYHVQVSRVADEALVAAINKGVRSPEGHLLRVKNVRILRGGAKNTWLEIALDEGKNRHIRRMLAAFDVEVLRLVRVAIGPLVLGTLPKGASRSLTQDEKAALDGASQWQGAKIT